MSIPIPGNRRTMENDICRKLRLAALVIGGLSVVIRPEGGLDVVCLSSTVPYDGKTFVY